MSAVAWFALSIMFSVVGAYVSIFALPVDRGFNMWVALIWVAFALINLIFILVVTLRHA